MPNEPVSERLCMERQEKQNERFARDLKRLEQLEESNEDLKKLTIEIKNLVKLNNDRLDKQEERLSAIEQRPLHWWEKFAGAIVTALGAAIGGCLLTMIAQGVIKG